jgi:hypothetical protein
MAHLIGGQPVGRSRIVWPSVANAVFQGAAFALIGWAAGLGADTVV